MEILFKLHLRIQIEWCLRENEMKNIHSLSFGICLHINVSQAKPNYIQPIFYLIYMPECPTIKFTEELLTFFCIKTIALKQLTIKK